MIRDGVILAGGVGSRLKPFTDIYSKQLLYLSGKAVIDYPIKTLTDLGVENITVILGSSFAGQVIDYCGDGSKYGANINYVYQKNPDGISHGISLCKRYVKNKFLVILGDNVFEKPMTLSETTGAKVFLTKHAELQRFGVATISSEKIIAIQEKPLHLSNVTDNYAITGLYQFDDNYFSYFSASVKSPRGEYEITDIIKSYNNDNNLTYQIIDGDWSDAGTIEGLNQLNYKMYSEIS